jgi:hypothetical protein
MNVTILTFDDLVEGARCIFYFHDKQVAFSAEVAKKYYSVAIPSNEQIAGLILVKISLLGDYDSQFKLLYNTLELTSIANLSDVYMFQIDFHKLPPDINILVQQYL